MAIRIPGWTGRAALGVVVTLFLAWFVLGWFHANTLRSELMLPHPDDQPFDIMVRGLQAGRITVDTTDETTRQGVWGLESDAKYAQLGPIVRADDDSVERGVTPQVGMFAPGDAARIDIDAYTGDPTSALSVGFEALRSPADIGPQPAWFIDGRRPTWVIFVHGYGSDRLTESLRITPSLVSQGYPVMSITIRNDVDATPSESGLRYWGQEEWRDVDAAIESGLRKGARDFVIVGSGFGASVVSAFLHESEQVDLVRAVVYDSPVLDLESVAVGIAEDSGTPGAVGWLGRRLTALRFGMDWGAADQLDRTDEFDVPILLLYGAQDPVTSVDTFEDFADALPEIVTTHRFEQGGHTDLWNVDADRYELAIEEFLLDVIGDE